MKDSLTMPGAYPDSDNDAAAETDFPRSLRPAMESCLPGRGSHLTELRVGYKPEQILDAVASLYPEEIQLHFLQGLVEDCYPSVYLRDKRDLDDIVKKEFGKCRGFTKKVLTPVLEEAIFSTSVVRLDLVFEEPVEGHGTIEARVPTDFREVCGWVKHFEWCVDVAIDLLGDECFKPGLLVKGIGAMESLKSQLPNVEDFTMRMRMLTNLPTAAEAKEGQWLNGEYLLNDGKYGAISSTTVGQALRGAITSAELSGPGEKTYLVLSITRPYDTALPCPPEIYSKWKIQSRRIDVTGLSDVSGLVHHALSTAENVPVTDDDVNAFQLAGIGRGDGT